MSGILSCMIFLPLVGMAVVLFIPEKFDRAIKWVSLVTCLATLLVAVGAWAEYANLTGAERQIDFVPETGASAEYPFQPPLGERVPWIPQVNIYYEVGVDGLSLPLILLTCGLMVLVIIYSWNTISDRVKWYYVFFLLLETAMLGVFVSLDLFLFYVFFEVGLVPMYFLIGIWGGPRREYAAIKFFLYTLVGSLAMLLSILAIYYFAGQQGQPTFSILKLAELQPVAKVFAAGGAVPALIFWGIFLGFAIKVPMWPFHTWLPDAHVEAPTAGSVILAGVLLKLGTYGFVRILIPLLPQQCESYGIFVVILAGIAIVYGALVAMDQKDLKKLVAYSSVNHMGYVMLGIGAAMMVASQLSGGGPMADRATMAVNGAILQMVAHGIITGGLFFMVGIIYERTHTRMIEDYGGILKLVPQYSGMLILLCLASLGLPTLAGFVAEFHVFVGSVGTGIAARAAGVAGGDMLLWVSCLSILGVIITAAYFLRMIQRVLLGPVSESLLEKCHGVLPDMNLAELVSLAPLAFFTVLIGLVPGPVVLDMINEYTYHLLTSLRL